MENISESDQHVYLKVFEDVKTNLLRDSRFFGFLRYGDRVDAYLSMTRRERVEEGRRLLELNGWDREKVPDA